MLLDIMIQEYYDDWKSYIEDVGVPAVLLFDKKNTSGRHYEMEINEACRDVCLRGLRMNIDTFQPTQIESTIIKDFNIDYLPLVVVFKDKSVIARGNPVTDIGSILDHIEKL